MSDIVAAGYDAGIRLGEVIKQDMIAVPASGPQRLAVVRSPALRAFIDYLLRIRQAR